MSDNNYARLCPGKFGFAMGFVWGLGMLILAWAGWLFDYGTGMTASFAGIYWGMAPTFVGGILGFVWGLIDFFIFGWLMAVIYNCCCKSCGKS